ncbi:MAG: GTP 3',8-cyclase MoaA [Candidatus Omnitrophica bacterium]|nr:GTP 3',8-cyclase MoaA [Candidatus Omnitrophota bacterium]
MSNPIDLLNRPLQDLRISVIDRCNFRCTYCMPREEEHGPYQFLSPEQWLSYDEIYKIAEIFVQCGVRKIRLTGGEPLLRPKITDLIRSLSQIPGIEDLALTTNGSKLQEHAVSLKQAGLNRLTVSLDTLDSRIFKQMNGTNSPLKDILLGIKSAEACGFKSIKINVVIQKGVNDHQIIDIVEYFRGSGNVVRFIEYMDVGTCNHWDRKYVVSSKEIFNRINEKYPLEPVNKQYYGEVSSRYRFSDGKGEIGFISSVTQPFCQSCTRIRLTTDGRLVTCLFAETGPSIKDVLRSGVGDAALKEFIRNLWKARNDQYSNLRAGQPAKSLTSKIEMFQVGG